MQIEFLELPKGTSSPCNDALCISAAAFHGILCPYSSALYSSVQISELVHFSEVHWR